MESKLFSEFRLRDLMLENRVVVSPMAQYSSDEKCCATAWHLMHVGNLVVSGARLVIMEATAVGLIEQAEQAEAVLQDESADLIALGLGMTYNPRWAWHASAQFGKSSRFPVQYARSQPSMKRGDPLTAFQAKA